MFEHELSDFERDEIKNRISGVFKERINEPIFQEEYKKCTNNQSVEYTWYALSGYKPSESEVSSPMIKLMIKFKENTFEMNDITKKALLESCKNRVDGGYVAAAVCAFAMAEKDYIIDKDLQEKILKESENNENYYLSKGEEPYENYLINKEMINHWVEEQYTNTIFKQKVFAEIEEIEKEPIPEK